MEKNRYIMTDLVNIPITNVIIHDVYPNDIFINIVGHVFDSISIEKPDCIYVIGLSMN